MRTSLSKAERALVLELLAEAKNQFKGLTMDEMSSDDILKATTTAKLEAKLLKADEPKVETE
jgi:hypothetical protein